jgi:hypothetical protein
MAGLVVPAIHVGVRSAASTLDAAGRAKPFEF